MRRCQNFILNYSGKWGSGDTWEIPGKGNRTAKLGSLRTNFVWRTAPLSAWLMPRIQGWWWGDPKEGGLGVWQDPSREGHPRVLSRVQWSSFSILVLSLLGLSTAMTNSTSIPGCGHCLLLMSFKRGVRAATSWARILMAGIRPRKTMTTSMFVYEWSIHLASPHRSDSSFGLPRQGINTHYRIKLPIWTQNVH